MWHENYDVILSTSLLSFLQIVRNPKTVTVYVTKDQIERMWSYRPEKDLLWRIYLKLTKDILKRSNGFRITKKFIRVKEAKRDLCPTHGETGVLPWAYIVSEQFSIFGFIHCMPYSSLSMCCSMYVKIRAFLKNRVIQ